MKHTSAKQSFHLPSEKSDVSTFDECYICNGPVGPRSEKDHFPFSKRHGGKQVAPICLTCHDLKDRVPLSSWDCGMAIEALWSLWAKANRIERIMLTKIISLGLDMEAKITSQKEETE